MFLLLMLNKDLRSLIQGNSNSARAQHDKIIAWTTRQASFEKALISKRQMNFKIVDYL